MSKNHVPVTLDTSTMALIPGGNRLLISRDVAEKTTKGGIVLPENALSKPAKGTIVSACSRTIYADSIGDVVYFIPHKCYEIEHDGKKFLVVHEDDVLATVEVAAV